MSLIWVTLYTLYLTVSEIYVGILMCLRAYVYVRMYMYMHLLTCTLVRANVHAWIYVHGYMSIRTHAHIKFYSLCQSLCLCLCWLSLMIYIGWSAPNVESHSRNCHMLQMRFCVDYMWCVARFGIICTI